jgi:hypothetical protein
MKKVCFKCEKEKLLTDFYAHPRMGDGRLNKCKECTKSDVSKNYADKREQYSQYDRQRQLTPERRKKKIEYMRKHRINNPEKAKARFAVSNALRSGQLSKQPCCVCGSDNNLHAHHNDYSKPLEVEWYCDSHHRILHGKHS